jgi:indolepyruvate ferredoxin oxidoreductase beta subunit
MGKTYSLMFAGVGGQGSLLIAELTSLAAVNAAGHRPRCTASRSVVAASKRVRFGETIYSPIVTPGQAQAVICLEKLEALRFAHYVDPEDGAIFVNEHEIIPPSVVNAEALYPHEVVEFLQGQGLNVITLPATQTAQELGDVRMANVVMLGALSTRLPIAPDVWERRCGLAAASLLSRIAGFPRGSPGAPAGAVRRITGG